MDELFFLTAQSEARRLAEAEQQLYYVTDGDQVVAAADFNPKHAHIIFVAFPPRKESASRSNGNQ